MRQGAELNEQAIPAKVHNGYCQRWESTSLGERDERTEVWLLTKSYEGQGADYADRGWPTWERAVAELLSDANAVLDLSKLTSYVMTKDTTMSMDKICQTCAVGRSPPMVPEDNSYSAQEGINSKGNIINIWALLNTL